MRGRTELARAARRRRFLRGLAACGVLPLSRLSEARNPNSTDADRWEGEDDEAHWAAVRSRFLFEPGHIYFNNASIGSPPEPVIRAVDSRYRKLAANPTSAKVEHFKYLETAVVPAVARFLGADPAELVLTKGASEGLYIIANGIELKPGDEVVTTTHEHPGGLTPWLVRAERSGIAVRQVPLPSPIVSAEQPIDILSRAVGPRTRVLFFCHVTRGGLLYPVKELCSLARSRGIVSAVDGAQAVGTLHVDLHGLGCDLYATSLHKWTLAPAGNGALYVRKDMQPRFPSLFRKSDADRTAAGYYEMLGTYHFPVRAATAAAFEFLESAGGVRRIERRNRMLSDYLKEGLAGIPKLKLVSSRRPEVSSPGVTMFEVPSMRAPDVLRVLLERYRIHVDEHVRDGHDAVRVSTHFYNSRSEVDRLTEAVRQIL